MGGATRQEIRCYDHGFVALVDAMPRLVPAGQTADAAIVQAARVSYGAGTKKVSEDRALLRYLLRHRHTTAFEMVEFKVHIAMPIFIARQWIRHRTASVNEYSGRYSIMPDRFYRPTPENVRKQSSGNRQGGADRFATAPAAHGGPATPGATDESGLLINPGGSPGSPGSPVDEARTAAEFLKFLDDSEGLYSRYLKLTEQGVSREMARIGLPVSLYTEWYWKCDLHNILRFLSLRMDSHAQEEIRVYAQAMHDLIVPIVPVTMEAFRDYELESVRLTRLEIEALRSTGHAVSGRETRDLATENKREQAEWQAKKKALGL
ncbi:MAG: FAD-dependent thymidylate synthase [Phycisphaerales bacterium]